MSLIFHPTPDCLTNQELVEARAKLVATTIKEVNRTSASIGRPTFPELALFSYVNLFVRGASVFLRTAQDPTPGELLRTSTGLLQSEWEERAACYPLGLPGFPEMPGDNELPLHHGPEALLDREPTATHERAAHLAALGLGQCLEAQVALEWTRAGFASQA